MNSDFISIIIPVYNTEKYLSECINSILNQTYENFELLLIDDGSTDESLKICNDFKEKDGRVKVFHHENHGVSYTRNRGITLSKGDYIAFIDADDYILPQYLEKLLEVAHMSGSSSKVVSFCRFCDLKTNNKVFERDECYDNLKYGKRNLNLAIEDIFSWKLFGSICRMLIPSELIKSNSLLFFECKFMEDQLFLFDLINYADAFKECDEYLYVYRYNTDSASRTPYIKGLIIDQSRYLYAFRNKLDSYSLDYEIKEKLFSYAILDAKVLLITNAAMSNTYYAEIKAIRRLEYFGFPVNSVNKLKWKRERGKTKNIVIFLADRNMYFLIYCFMKFERSFLRLLKKG